VAAIEFLPVIALAALGARSARNGASLILAAAGVYLLTHVRLARSSPRSAAGRRPTRSVTRSRCSRASALGSRHP
jgi:hypothetical protein